MNIRDLKSQAQTLKPVLKVGKAGLSAEFIQEFQHAQTSHPLLKIQFTAHKEEKKVLAAKIAELTGSEIIQQVGNVVVFYKPKE